MPSALVIRLFVVLLAARGSTTPQVPERVRFFTFQQGSSCAQCHSSDASPGIPVPRNAATVPSTAEHRGLDRRSVIALAGFANAVNPDGFFGPNPPSTDPQLALQAEKLRSLGYTSPSLGGYTRLSATQLLAWSSGAHAGPAGQAILAAAPGGGEVLVAVVARRSGPYELVVMTDRREGAAPASLVVRVASMSQAPRHYKFKSDTHSVLLPMQAGRNLVLIGNEGPKPMNLTSIVLTPR